jgi:sec-independent protein translocase protein TatB
MMRTVGQWAGRARAMADQFRRSFDDIARQSELDELRAEVNRLQQNYVPPAAEIESAMYPQGLPSSPTADIPVSSPAADAPAPTPAPAPAPVEPPSETVRS